MTEVRCSAPTLETDRLRLRAWRKNDREAYFRILQEPAVFRHFGPEPMGMEECWRRVMAAAGGWQLNGFGGWAVERKSDAKLVGMLAVFTAWRGLDPEFGDEPEMGWIMDPETQGQGLGSEAGLAALEWLEANVEPTPAWAIISPDNDPSLKLADRLGFERVTDVLYNDDPTVVLRRPSWA